MAKVVRRKVPRLLVRVRAFWRGVGEVLAFFGSGVSAIVRFVLGRWPEPRGRDFISPRGPNSGRNSA
jgi:hypothetical protein